MNEITNEPKDGLLTEKYNTKSAEHKVFKAMLLTKSRMRSAEQNREIVLLVACSWKRDEGDYQFAVH